MNFSKSVKLQKKALIALKIALGSILAIIAAEALGLQFAASAGIVALLTIVSTKMETFKLSLFRVITFMGATLLAYFLFKNIEPEWMAFSIYIFAIVLVCQITGLQGTISVNAVIGTHFMATLDFSPAFILNEFMIVLIGITIAIIANLFQPNALQKNRITKGIKETEQDMQKILEELANYMQAHPFGGNVWDDIIALDARLAHYVEEAYEYQDNTFATYPEYYIWYFEMRASQCHTLHNLHYEMKKMRTLPEEAGIIADFITDMKDHVDEFDDPQPQLQRLHGVIDQLNSGQPPRTMDEFDGRARLYHILMTLEEFLTYKKRFLDSLQERHFRIYWKQDAQPSAEAHRAQPRQPVGRIHPISANEPGDVDTSA